MSTSQNNLELALSNVPEKFKKKIINTYLELKQRYSVASRDSSWDAAGLSAGKFCESILRLLQNELTGNHIAFGKHIPNFADECGKLLQLPKTVGNESTRVIIPRALVYLYTLRGKRGIGHVGGDVEANQIDMITIVRNCDWIICELIRIYHNLSLEEAQAIVDTLSQREMPFIWQVAGKKRILKPGLSYKQQTLLLLYTEPETGVLTEDLCEWIEHPKVSDYKKDVLKKLHSDRLIEYDKSNEIIYLSPAGIEEVETKILNN